MRLTRTDIESLPNFKRKTAKEYSSSCPICLGGGGEDRFLFWPDSGNYYCRQCEAKGFVTDAPGGWSPEARERFMAEAAERQTREREVKRAALDAMGQCHGLAQQYHERMNGQRRFWHDKGLTDTTIDAYRLGFCPQCPTYQESPSWTIPVFFRGKLLNIRHRLAEPPSPGDKYRPERAGLPAVMFNADWLLDSREFVVLVEGEVKAMVLSQAGFPAVGIPGANTFSERWVRWFGKQKRVYVALDPGADGHARDIVTMLGGRARLCSFPVKPDDAIVRYGATAAQMMEFLKQGKRLC